jgi:ABC-type enterochelin transport system permease subunit
MLSLLVFALFTSFMLGVRHATDPDHVLAVSTIVSEERSLARAAGIGALWGMGHTLTILLVGAAIILLKLELSPRLGLSMEFAVAVMLIVLGCLNLFEVGPKGGRLTTVRPLLVGVVHGLAGSAAATLLVLPLIPDPRWAAAYLLVFGIGTIAGMALMTLAIAAPSVFAATRVAGMRRWIRVASGALSLCFGLYLAHRIGFTDGLFTGAPRWTPE